MSQEEIHIGKLRKIVINQPIEDWCKDKCNLEGITELHSYNNDWIEEFKDKFYDKYFFVKDQIFEVFDHKEFEYEDIYYLKDNNDGTFDFVMKFYNGGTCLSECIEEELEKIIQ